MRTRFVAAVLACLFPSCQRTSAPTSSAPKESRAPTAIATSIQRPAIDFTGLYNVPPSSIPNRDSDYWVESDGITAISADEFYEVNREIVVALSKYGIVNGSNADFYVRSDGYYDRTQRIELNITERLPRIISPAVAEIQHVLKKHSTWRARFAGQGNESQEREQCFVVYPEVVRIRQLDNSKRIEDAVIENARLRMAHHDEQTEHLRQRVSELKVATQLAFAQMDSSDEDIALVAWFDTVSALYWDWSLEGKSGMSVWFLMRRPIPDDNDDYLQSNTDHSTFWAQPDGSVTAFDDERKEDSRQLIHFENLQELQTELVFRLNGKQHRYTRPVERPNNKAVNPSRR